MKNEKRVVIPTLKTLKPSLSSMSDEELDKLIGNVRADRRKLVSDHGAIKRKGKTKVKGKKKTDLIDLMSPEEKAAMKKYLQERKG